MIQDSGTRREFETGAVRDIAEGKGRCDLLPLDVVSDYFEYLRKYLPADHITEYIEDVKKTDAASFILHLMNKYINQGDDQYIYLIIKSFIADSSYKDNYTAILELSKHFEEGCNKYGERNWQKGIPAHCYIDSAVRHYLKFLRGDKDERHDRAFVWNLVCLLWTIEHKPEMNDLPFATKENN